MTAHALVVIPARNEERMIAAVLAELRQSAPCCDRVVIDDASSDATGQIVAELGERQISLPSRLGYGLALAPGLRYALAAGYETILSFDADGQHRAEDVRRLVAAMAGRSSPGSNRPALGLMRKVVDCPSAGRGALSYSVAPAML